MKNIILSTPEYMGNILLDVGHAFTCQDDITGGSKNYRDVIFFFSHPPSLSFFPLQNCLKTTDFMLCVLVCSIQIYKVQD